MTLIAAISFWISSCSMLQSEGTPSGTDSLGLIHFVEKIDNSAQFKALAGDPLSDKFNRVEAVKVVYDVNTKKVYFMQSQLYEYHFSFCKDQLGYWSDLSYFNTTNYKTNPLQQFILSTLCYYEDQDVYTLEFTSSSVYDPEQFDLIFHAVQSNFYEGHKLKILNATDYLFGLYEDKQLTLPQIGTTELFKQQQYQLLYPAEAIGRLIYVDSLDKTFDEVLPTDILVIHGTPLFIPPCAGIITDVPQSPLSHIHVLSKHRQIPACMMRHIWDSENKKQYDGQPIQIKTTADSVSFRIIDENEWKSHLSSLVLKEKTDLKFDDEVVGLFPIKQISIKDSRFAGNKASAFGELAKVGRRNSRTFVTPEGAFVIPFSYYKKHLDRSGARALIEHLLTDPSTLTNGKALKKSLKSIRQKIKSTAPEANLVSEVKALIIAQNAGDHFRFRSSSNAEDIAGFSGAGLYNSKTAILNDTAKTIEKAILDVWAGAWNYGAFTEREVHSIDHRDVRMAVLVHRSFPDEMVNGVAITAHLYRSEFTGFTINLQKGDIDVVSPPEGIMAEQVILINTVNFGGSNARVSEEFITFSSLSPSEPILNQDQYAQLYEALELVKTHFYWNTSWDRKGSFTDYALDIEFKFDQNGQLYLKQVRPY